MTDLWPLPDATGDGLGDLVAVQELDRMYVLPGTTRGLDLDVRQVGVELAGRTSDMYRGTGHGVTGGDLDGDGLAEVIVYATQGTHQAVYFYSGADIAAAAAAAGLPR
jgi:hypothetical protein